MKAAAITLIVLSASVLPVEANDLPRFDVEKHCAQVASFGGSTSEALRQGCFDMEQSAYDTLKVVWSGLPSTMRKHCLEVASFGSPGSYSLLEGCVQMEQSAKQGNSSRKFKY